MLHDIQYGSARNEWAASTRFLGNAPAHQLFDLIQISGPEAPRAFVEYAVTKEVATPTGVQFRWVIAPNGHVR